ncbi:MAG: extracellular solute-binding protein [Anaerolineales bacterium]
MRLLAGAFITLIVGLSLLSACAGGAVSGEVVATHIATSTQPAPTPAGLPSPDTPVAVTVSPPMRQKLTLWLPPQFDPSAPTAGAKLFRDRLQAFEQQNPQVEVTVRLKALSGPAGLLEMLTAAHAAAPAALPSLVALTRFDLETAAIKGIVYPFETSFDAGEEEEDDWLEYARQLGQVQGSAMGLPFAGDALVLLYRPSRAGSPPKDWLDLLQRDQPILFPVADPYSLLTLDLYLSAGGVLQDNQSKPMLQAEILEKVLRFYVDGADQNSFPEWMVQLENEEQTWQSYREQNAHWLVTHSSYYLANPPADTLAAPLPSLSSGNFTLAGGWLWAVADPDPQRRQLAELLAQYLTDETFLRQWSPYSGYLPVRASSLSGWDKQTLRMLAGEVTRSAQVQPPGELVNILGPILQEATIAAIRDHSNPTQIAQTAAAKLVTP